MNIPLSVLDLVPVAAGKSIATSFNNSVSLARHAEQLGYQRFWLSEHHGMEGVASSATALLVGHIAGNTQHIRVGSGGIMLPNHAPLIVAEQFGTLATLYPGRIDLGLGRAPGTDPHTAAALRRQMNGSPDDFPRNVVELMGYFTPQQPSKVKAVPGVGLDVPVWILGSSLFGAQLAGMLGLPFAFASHFAPTMLSAALDAYRRHFTPSAQLQQPYAMAGVNIIVADTDAEARYLATSQYQFMLNVVRGTSNPLPPPTTQMDTIWTEQEKLAVMQMLQYQFTGSQHTVHQQLKAFVSQTGVNELMVVTNTYDHEARLRSYQLLAHTCTQAKPAAAAVC